MKTRIDVLDQGFVRIVDTMPSEPGTADMAIVEAARVSYQNGTSLNRNERGLIRYLMRNWHTSPFEMAEVKLHIKMPIFVARQWMRHRTASINEVSARYSILPDESYIPQEFGVQSKKNKQGSETGLTDTSQAAANRLTGSAIGSSMKAYSELLELGVSREQSRLVLPVATYTEFYWKANLLNVMRLLQLRMDHHAQSECQAYARAIFDLMLEFAPLTMEAFSDYWIGGQRMSKDEWALIREALNADQVTEILAEAKDKLSPSETLELERRFT